MKRLKVVKQKKVKEKPQTCEVKAKCRWLKVLTPCLLLAVFCAAALAWALPLVLKNKTETPPSASYQGVLELWNVETFEGGSGSRSAWLTNKAAKFEAQNKGLFAHVTNLSVAQMTQKLNAGETFDIICFSRGAGALIVDKLAVLDVDLGNVTENFRLSAQHDGKQLCAPLYAGAYCLFARSAQLDQENLLSQALSAKYTRKVGKNTFDLAPLVCGFTEYNSPLSALAMAGGKGKVNVSESVTQYQAYEQFVANKTAITLLGTQRDIYRLTKREADGKIDALSFCALGGYTDLVQYVGVSNSCGDKLSSAAAFVSYLLSAQSQASLTDISMFSVLGDAIYTSERFSACEKALTTAYVPNAFSDAQAVKSQRATAVSTLALS